MNKIELIEKISDRANVQQSEQKLFFENLIRRIAEELNEEEFLSITGLGRFEFRRALNNNENDLIVFISNENEEFLFTIPEEDETIIAEPVDSYFSISIGKPIIPLKGSGKNEFFLPQSGDEVKKILELKVEKLIDESSKYKSEPEDIYDLDEIKFPFINWKKSSDLNEEIDKIEQDLDESFQSEIQEEENKTDDDFDQLIETEYIPEEFESEVKKNEETISNEIEILEPDDVKDEISEIKEEENGSKEQLEEPVQQDIINEEIKNKVDEPFSKTEENKIIDEIKKVDEPALLYQEKQVEIEKSGITNTNVLVDEDKETVGTKKKTFGKYILAALILLASAAVFYFFYFYQSAKDIPVTTKDIPKEFNVVIERTYDIPVSYPYQSGMFGSVFSAIDKELLKPIDKTDPGNASGTAKVAEIRNAIPSTRIKGYIYQYNDGTFAVQVSSFKSRSVAISETQRYLDAGYTAFVEQTKMSDKPYYRIRVGGFKSIADAEKFSQTEN